MTRSMLFDGVEISDDSDCYFIAEIGHNHQGKVDQCKELFLAAKNCGANAVKLQKRDNKELFTKEMFDSPYNSYNSYGATYGEHRNALEFNEKQYRELQEYCKEINITLFATPFDFSSADFLKNLDMPAYKIASGDLTNIPLIKYVASFQKPVVISTGGGTMEDVIRAYDAAIKINKDLCIMQCTSGYPPAWEETNLKVISTFRDKFQDINIGFSSHDSGIAMALAGYVLGARMIEKHFTLNRSLKGTDHAFSLEHSGLSKLIRDVRRARIAMGDGIKCRYESEKKPLYKMEKKLVASVELKAGTTITAKDIALRCPNDGVPAYQIDEFIGKTLKRDLLFDENITFTDFE